MQLKATNSQNVSQSLEKVNTLLIGLITTKTSRNSAEEHLAPAPDDSYYQAVFNNVDIPLQTMQWLGLSISEWKFEGVGKTFEYTFMEEN